MRKESIELFKTLNAEMKNFTKNNKPIPNEVKMYQSKINQFYKKNGINAQKNQFTTRAKLTPDQENELNDLAIGMMNNNDVHFLTDYQNILESGKFKRFGVTDVDDLIKTMDFLKNAQDEEIVKNVLSSSQIIEIFSQATKKGIQQEDIIRRIVDKYKKTGLTGSELHESMYKSIKQTRLGKGVQKNLGVAGKGKQRPSIKGSKQKQGRGLKTLYGIDNED